MIKKYLLTILLLFPAVVFAEEGLGVAAQNINAIIAFIYRIVDVILYMGAAIMGISGLLKYRLHRQNPQQVPLSTPLTELAIAGVLVLLGVLAQLSTSHKTVEKPGMPQTNIQTYTPAPTPVPAPAQGTTQAPRPAPNQYPY